MLGNCSSSSRRTYRVAIIFFAVVLGLGIAAIGEKGKVALNFFEGIANAMFYVTNLFMKYAPIGVFALIGVTISKYGFSSLIPLAKLALTVYGTMIFFVIVVLGIMAKIIGEPKRKKSCRNCRIKKCKVRTLHICISRYLR